MYLTVVLDWFSRRVLAWKLSITLKAAFCIDAVEEAIARFGVPEIFNTDQGSQFISSPFIADANGKQDRELLEALAKPKHNRHTEMTKWLGAPFDPRDAETQDLADAVDTLARK